MVLHITRCEHARHAGHRGHAVQASLGDDVAVFHLQLALEDVGVGLVADGDETPLEGDFFGGAGFCRRCGGASQAHASDATGIAQHLVQRIPQVQLDLACGHLGHDFVDEDGLGAELVATVDQVHFLGDVAEVESFFDSGVAATHHAHRVTAVEKAVAGGAATHALAHEGGLAGQAQVLGTGASGDDQSVAAVGARIADQSKRALAEVDRVNVVEDDLRVESFGVLKETLHQLRALDAGHVGGPVVDIGGRHQLPALCNAGDEHGLEVGARGVQRCRVAGRARAEDENACVLCGSGHVSRRIEIKAVFGASRRTDALKVHGASPLGSQAYQWAQ